MTMPLHTQNVNALHVRPTLHSPLGLPGMSFRFEEDKPPTAPGEPTLPADVQAKLDRLAQYEQLNLEPDDISRLSNDYLAMSEERTRWKTEKEILTQQNQPPIEPDKKKQKLRETAKAELLEILPELGKLGDLSQVAEQLKQVMNNQQQGAIVQAQTQLVNSAAELVQRLQIDTTTTEGMDLAVEIGDLVERTVMGDQKLLSRYTQGDTTVGKEVIKQLANSPLIKRLNIPRKVAPRKPFTSFNDIEGDSSYPTVSDITKDLPKRNTFRELALRTHDLIFPKEQ